MKKEKLQIEINWYDRVVGFFSPSALVGRKRAKIHSEYLSRKYEGATSGRRAGGWVAGGGSANSEIAGSKINLRNRSRDLIRNNPYAARGVQVITNNVVGKGIKTKIKLDTRATISTKEKRINAIWRAWAESPACDFEGKHDLAGLQRIVMRAIVESGDVLVRVRRTQRRRVTGPDGKTIEIPPIQLQILEGDFVAVNQVNRVLKNGNTVIEGIEVDQSGRVVAYHLYKNHPGNININIQNSFDTVRVPAEELLFPYRMDRPGQLSGVPWLAPIMLRLRDFDLYEDAQLKRQQCAAMFTAFIHDIEAPDDLGESEIESEIGEKMEPGIMEILPPGKDIKLSSPPGADNYDEYTSVVLRSIASGLGITYFDLTSDLADINFSAGRLGWLEAQRNYTTWQNNIMINQFLSPVFNWFKGSLELIGQGSPEARGIFTPPKREMIDPVKETEALKAQVRSGFKTHTKALAELGEDADEHFAQYAEDMKTLDSKELVLDSDARKRDNAGKLISEPQETEAPTENE